MKYLRVDHEAGIDCLSGVVVRIVVKYSYTSAPTTFEEKCPVQEDRASGKRFHTSEPDQISTSFPLDDLYYKTFQGRSIPAIFVNCGCPRWNALERCSQLACLFYVKSQLELVRVSRETSRHRHRRHPSRRGLAQTERLLFSLENKKKGSRFALACLIIKSERILYYGAEWYASTAVR